MATYKHLSDLLKICSVLPALAIMPAMATTVDISDDTVIENQTNSDGSNQNAAGLTLSYGDKLSTNGANNVVFNNNSSVNSGGAMKALNGFVAGDSWTFTGNHSDKISGGLYVKIPESYEGVDPENINRDVVFGKNTTFTGNSSKDLGGALGIESAGTVTIGDNAKFESNSTEADGGAIAIWTDASNGATTGTTLTLGRTDFTNNTAANRGGAIANLNNDKPEKKTDFYNTVNIASGSTFTGNSAKTGGAIYNLGTMNIAATFTGNTANTGGAIFNNDTGKITEISNTLFQGNTAKNHKDAEASLTDDVYAQGGAIYNRGSIGAINGDFINNSAHTTSETASKATANGGALSLYQSTIDSITGNFIGNTATAEIVGADKDYSDEMVSGDKLVSAGGGAIHIEGKWATGDVTKIGAINGNFENNSANGDAYANGGAIYIKAGTDTDVSIDNITGNFVNNKVIATTDNTDITKTSTGGAISIKESGHDATVAINGDFIGNSVTTNQTVANGGAIYNEGDLTVNGDFINNYASSQLDSNGANGGAIYNSGVLTLNGDNTFSGNMAGGVANDIHNVGTMKVASGTTTLGGGITGDGTLTLASGATLNIGSAKVVQNTIDLDGDIIASIVNANSFGQFVGHVDLSADSELTLDVGAAGEYSIFGNAEIEADKITYNDSVFNLTTDGNKIVVSTKSVDEIMENTNLSTGAANAINIMANAKDDVLNTISLRAQQDMVAGKTGNAEKELAKLNPDDKPVAQSVASSVQNQVLSLAAGRMSGASVGRSGGDLTSADYGMWVQGLYNHSKYNGRFSGDTMGISVGADTLIDGKYTLGIGYAYNDTDVDSNSRDTAIESHSVFLYGQYKPNEWYVNAALNYTMSNYTESADVYGVKLADAEYDVNSFGGQIMTGYDFVAGNPASIFTPEVGVRYLHVAQDAYQGTLGDVDALDTDYLTGVAGIKYAFEIESDSELKFRPELRAAATYDFMSDAAVATVNAPGNVAYVIDADRLSRFGGEFGIGLAAQYRGLEVSLNYDLDLHEDYTSQTGMLKFRYDF